MAGTRTPSQSRRCYLRTRRIPRAGPGHRQAAGLLAQSGFQFRLGLRSVYTNSWHPGEPPGDRRGAGGDGRGRQYCRPRPGRLHCATRARSLGSGREISGCGDGSVGALGWPSLGPRARLPGLRDWERVTRAPLGGTPPPRIQALPCTASRTPPNNMVGEED